MQCASVGAETWLFFVLTTGLVCVFVVRSGHTQRWLRAHPGWARGLGLMLGFERVLEERNLWLFRILFGPIPLLMWAASLSAVYCFFHGPDYLRLP
jgi:hypothetical protein